VIGYEPGPRFLIVPGKSKLCSLLQCADISGTRLHCCSQKRHLKVVVSGSLASSTMLPTELAASESLYAMLLSNYQTFSFWVVGVLWNVRFDLLED
jgi:hypothetical protein